MMSCSGRTAPAKSTEKAPERHDDGQGLEVRESYAAPKLIVSIPHLHRMHVSGRQGQSTCGRGRRQGLSYWLAILPQDELRTRKSPCMTLHTGA